MATRMGIVYSIFSVLLIIVVSRLGYVCLGFAFLLTIVIFNANSLKDLVKADKKLKAKDEA